MSHNEKTTAPSDTIAAIATPAGSGGVGIIRVSGQDISNMAAILNPAVLPKPRHAALRTFADSSGNTLDNGIALYFLAPHSFTGEEVLELHAHGGAVLLQTLLKRCFELGARQAQAGEFSMRAFYNGKINLTQAEAIADMITARSEAAVRAAARSLRGEFSQVVTSFINRLSQVRAQLESSLDFSDDDAQILAADVVVKQCDELLVSLTTLISQAKQGVLISGGMEVVIVGAPNSGKSSLLNCLAKESAAIVSEVAGTTRDLVQREIAINGMPFKITDSAGLHESDNAIEQEGMRRTRARVESADIIISLAAPDLPFVDLHSNNTAAPPTAPVIRAQNKIDITPAASIEKEVLAISAKTGEGIPALQQALINASQWREDDTLFSARTRHLTALQEASHFLQKARADFATPEVAAAWLRESESALVGILGTRTEEDLLGIIFSQFCIGK